MEDREAVAAPAAQGEGAAAAGGEEGQESNEDREGAEEADALEAENPICCTNKKMRGDSNMWTRKARTYCRKSESTRG